MKVKYIILSTIIFLGCSHEPAMNLDGETAAEILEEKITLEALLSDTSLLTIDAILAVDITDKLVLHPKGNAIAPSHVLITSNTQEDFNEVIQALNKRTEMVVQSGGFSVWTLENGQVWFYQHPSAGWVLEFRLK